MKSKKRTKPVAHPQALFDAVEGEASSDASSVFGSAAQALAESDAALVPVEEAIAQAVFAQEERAILEQTPDRVLAQGRQDAERAGLDVVPIGGPVDAPASALDDAAEEQGEGTGGDADEPADEPGQAQEAPAASMLKNRESMSSVALVFLEDAMARRLAVAWEVCGGSEDDWFDAAGFTTKQHAEARRIARALRLHGVCRDGGVTDKLAIDYISAVIARPLTAAAKKKP